LLEGGTCREFRGALHGRFEFRDATAENASNLQHIRVFVQVSALLEVLEIFEARRGDRRGPYCSYANILAQLLCRG